jgi:serine phosphatase RsbU (regulator of sigma subunit)
MEQGRTTTIFKQLVFNIVIPTLLALLVIAGYNFLRTRDLLRNHLAEKNEMLADEITKLLKFQDVAFRLVEAKVDDRLRKFSDVLVNQYFLNTDNLDRTDLREIAVKAGLDTANEDIYIIRRDGVVVNTTFPQDQGINLYTYGEKFRDYLLDIFRNRNFVTDLFTIEGNTKRPKKYTYQPTRDRRYIVELGAYSAEADEIISFIEATKQQIKDESEGIVDVELFLLADKPFSMNRNALQIPAHEKLLLESFRNRDTTVVERTDGKWYQYRYIYLEREESNLYKGSVIRIISDVTGQQALFRKEALIFSAIFGITMLVLAWLIYRKTRLITLPVRKLVENVDRITNGNLRERAEVSGNNEVTRLSEKFNMMIDQLEGYYYELEEKVKERTLRIEQQKAEIEDQKKHIVDSIRYARRIQNAILPSFSIISRHLKNYFVLYQPKDVVSGDFYWVHEADGLVMVAAVDCTGHGVPGAFMSIVGFSQLNYVVEVKKARSASLILDELNRGVITTLNESNTSGSIKDGMDIALCVFDMEAKKGEYAGANNPLCIVRNHELIKFKADRFPIGVFEGHKPQLFTNNCFELIDGDCIYLFSDGFADQFGGPENKKFMSRRFEELLVEISTKPMEVQKEMLLRKLSEWKGQNDQVDDILVIGIMI